MTKREIRTSVMFTLLLCTLTACAHRVGSQVPVTHFEQALVSNAILASVNNSVTHGVIASNQAGVLPTDKAKAVLAQTERIAKVSDELTTILAKGPDAATLEATKIRELIGQVQLSVTALVADGSLGIKNPESQQTVLAEVQTIGVVANQILAQLQLGGVLK